jgi:hypothetical protein
MANAEHLALLKQGTAIWNDWRISNPEALPDLSRADLSWELWWANRTRNANLTREADLSGADLSRADLGEANLGGANLSGANLGESEAERSEPRRGGPQRGESR